LIKSQKSYETTSAEADMQKVEVDLYAIKEKVNQLFFNLLILQENRKNLDITLENLKERERALESGYQNGLILESELQTLQVEMLKIRQAMLEVDAGRQTHLDMLNIYTGNRFTAEDIFQNPVFEQVSQQECLRPEFKWFDLKIESLDAGKALARSSRMPLLYAFGQAGYGKPGYNMISNDWDTYYMIGAGLKWNIWDWSKNKRQRKILEQQQVSIMNQRDAFDQNMKLLLAREKAQIDRYRKSIGLDEKMLYLQIEILEAAASRLENGVLTASEYIIELNRENLARIRVDTDRIQLSRAVAAHMMISGTL
jgi:outer membrane protein TolC